MKRVTITFYEIQNRDFTGIVIESDDGACFSNFDPAECGPDEINANQYYTMGMSLESLTDMVTLLQCNIDLPDGFPQRD